MLAKTSLGTLYLAQRNLFSYPLTEKCKLFSDCTWLDSYKEFDEYKVVKEMALIQTGKTGTIDLATILQLSVRLKMERAQLKEFHSAILNTINETSLKELCGKYFPGMIKEFDDSRNYFQSLNNILAADFPFSLSLAPHFWSKPMPQVTLPQLAALDDADNTMKIYSQRAIF